MEGMRIVGIDFRDGILFVPEVLLAANAMKAAKGGKSVAAIEQYYEVGGGSTHWATVPSKALRAAIQHINLVHQNPLHGARDAFPSFSLPRLLGHAHTVEQEQTRVRAGFYHHTGVRIYHGHARFVDEHTICGLALTGMAGESVAVIDM